MIRTFLEKSEVEMKPIFSQRRETQELIRLFWTPKRRHLPTLQRNKNVI